MDFIVGIDIGTSGTKAIAYTVEGIVLQTAYRSYEPLVSITGTHEQDPELLYQAVIDVIADILRVARPTQLIGISLSAAMHSLIVVDKQGLPLTHAITWADLRSNEQALQLKKTDQGKAIYRHTGTPIHPMSPLCKIMWLKEKQPTIFQNAHKFISVKEFIWFRFFGKYQIDYSIASATGLFDIFAFNWFEPSLIACGIAAGQLSDPVAPTHIETDINDSVRLKWDLPAGIPFIIGASDGCLANLGSSAVHAGDMAVTIGTSGAVRMTCRKPSYDPRERIFNYILSEDLYVCGGPMNNGGVVVKWFVENFMHQKALDDFGFDALIQQAGALDPGCEGLICLPYLFGERAPIWDANAKAVFFGIQQVHTQLHFLRSVIEGIVFSLYQIGLSVEETIGYGNNIFASGGFTRSSWWLQLLADVFNKKVCVTNTADASAIGAAILGLFALRKISSFDQASQNIFVEHTYKPYPEKHLLYMKNYAIFSILYDKLKDEFIPSAEG